MQGDGFKGAQNQENSDKRPQNKGKQVPQDHSRKWKKNEFKQKQHAVKITDFKEGDSITEVQNSGLVLLVGNLLRGESSGVVQQQNYTTKQFNTLLPEANMVVANQQDSGERSQRSIKWRSYTG